MNPTERQALLENIYKSQEFRNGSNNIERICAVLEIQSLEKIKESCRENQETAYFRSKKCGMRAVACKVKADSCLAATREVDLSESKTHLDSAINFYREALRYIPNKDAEDMSRIYYQLALIARIKNDAKTVLYHVDLAIAHLDRHCNGDRFKGLTADYVHLKLWGLNTLKRYKEIVELVDFVVKTNLLSSRPSRRSAASTNFIEDLNQLREMAIGKIDEGYGVEADVPNQDFFSYRFSELSNIVQSPVVGRHMVALDDIPEGTVLLEEKPYSLIVEEEYWTKKCNACYNELDQKYYPCEHCSDVVFCDETCYQKAYQTFHKHECGFMQILRNASAAAFHVYRMVSRIGAEQAFEVQSQKADYSIMNYLAEPNQRVVPEVEKNNAERCNAYKMSSILWDHNEKHDYHSNIHQTLMALELAAMLDNRHNFLANKSQEYKLQYIDMLLVDIRRIVFNVFGWHEYNEDWSTRGHVANCQCLVGSLINHSCVPNTNWGFENGQISFTTNTFIPKGTEITITYGPSKDVTYEKRQERLNHYYFGCRCTICLADGKKSNNLRCQWCSGPVVYGMPLNKEENLSGKCLVCFEREPEFDEKSQKLEKLKTELNELGMASKFLNNDSVLASRAIEILFKMADLTLFESSAFIQAALTVSSIIRRAKEAFNNSEPADKNTLLNSFDQYFSVKFDSKLNDNETLANMLFWVDAAKANQETSPSEENAKVLANFQLRVKNLVNELTNIPPPTALELGELAKQIGTTVLNYVEV